MRKQKKIFEGCYVNVMYELCSAYLWTLAVRVETDHPTDIDYSTKYSVNFITKPPLLN